MNKTNLIQKLLSDAEALDQIGMYKLSSQFLNKAIKIANEPYDDFDIPYGSMRDGSFLDPEIGEDKFISEEKAKASIKLSEILYDVARTLGNAAGFDISDEFIATTEWDKLSLSILESCANDILEAVKYIKPHLN